MGRKRGQKSGPADEKAESTSQPSTVPQTTPSSTVAQPPPTAPTPTQSGASTPQKQPPAGRGTVKSNVGRGVAAVTSTKLPELGKHAVLTRPPVGGSGEATQFADVESSPQAYAQQGSVSSGATQIREESHGQQKFQRPSDHGPRPQHAGRGRGQRGSGQRQMQGNLSRGGRGVPTSFPGEHPQTAPGFPPLQSGLPQAATGGPAPISGKTASVQARPSQPKIQKQSSKAAPAQQLSDPVSVKKPSGDLPDMQILQEALVTPNPARRNMMSGGTLGRPIQIETNHFRITFTKTFTHAIHYDVQITPETPKRFLPIAMENFRKLYYPNRYPAFDGKRNLYSTGPLFDSSMIQGEVKVINEVDGGRDMDFKIQVKYTSYVDLTSLNNYMESKSVTKIPQDAIQCIDVVFRRGPSTKFTKVGRSFFSPPVGQVIKLSDGMELWYGFYQSAILGWKPFLNVDVAHKAFPTQQSVIQLIAELNQCSPENLLRYELDMRVLQKFTEIIKGLKVQYEIPNKPTCKRMYKVVGVVGYPAELKFKLENGTMTNVTEYYRTQKRYNIQYHRMPCLHVGSKEKAVYVPVELCSIPKGQVTNRKMNEEQTRIMIKQAATPTWTRKDKIIKALEKTNYANDPCLQEFGMSVSNQFTKINARILDAPFIKYQNGTVQPRDGVWRPEKFVQSHPLVKWAILNLDKYTRADSLDNFAGMVPKLGGSLGMNIERCCEIKSLQFSRDTRQLIQYFKDIQKYNMELLFIVLPGQLTTQAYCKVKQIAELEVGVLTQCIQSKTMNRMSPPTVTNILLKVNAKLNGKNHFLGPQSKPQILARPCMIVGADVTHPSPDQTTIPSVAAVAASHDPNASCYNFCWRLQPPRTEIIMDLENIMVEQLYYFYNKTAHKPEAIVFFRDGVSEGEFEKVRSAEVTAIHRACKRVQPDSYKPRITFLVVQKRHHTRFFPVNPKDGDRKNGNVPAGTCVDTDITHPRDRDFYLCSHASLQGVSRPTRYRVLWDDSELSEDALENLTYFMCHMFTRCTRSVSYPAPTYYAHLAAFRARNYLEGDNIDMDNLKNAERQRDVKQNICKGLPMYFV